MAPSAAPSSPADQLHSAHVAAAAMAFLPTHPSPLSSVNASSTAAAAVMPSALKLAAARRVHWTAGALRFASDDDAPSAHVPAAATAAAADNHDLKHNPSASRTNRTPRVGRRIVEDNPPPRRRTLAPRPRPHARPKTSPIIAQQPNLAPSSPGWDQIRSTPLENRLQRFRVASRAVNARLYSMLAPGPITINRSAPFPFNLAFGETIEVEAAVEGGSSFWYIGRVFCYHRTAKHVRNAILWHHLRSAAATGSDPSDPAFTINDLPSLEKILTADDGWSILIRFEGYPEHENTTIQLDKQGLSRIRKYSGRLDRFYRPALDGLPPRLESHATIGDDNNDSLGSSRASATSSSAAGDNSRRYTRRSSGTSNATTGADPVIRAGSRRAMKEENDDEIDDDIPIARRDPDAHYRLPLGCSAKQGRLLEIEAENLRNRLESLNFVLPANPSELGDDPLSVEVREWLKSAQTHLRNGRSKSRSIDQYVDDLFIANDIVKRDGIWIEI